jgi:hypothetical protein
MSPSVEALLDSARHVEQLEDGNGNCNRQIRRGSSDKDRDGEWDDNTYWTSDWGSEWNEEWQGGSEWQPKEDWNQSDWNWESNNWGEEASEWDEHIIVKDSTVRVELSGAELGDADLKALVRHLDSFMQRYAEKNSGHYVLNIDLSCNSYITDNGVATHLVSFLSKWPVCHRLKLYKNAIGDETLRALSSWVADGYVHELHLSDLFGRVTADAVMHLLREIHRKGAQLSGGTER